MRFLALALALFAQHTWADEHLPRPDHIVVVMMENKSFGQIIDNPAAPYINQLAKRGALFTSAYGVTHPSQPNYLAFFSGSTLGIADNACPLDLAGDNLASILIAHGRSFASYAETLPDAGYLGCMYGPYMRKHNPVSNWPGLSRLNLPFSAFPANFAYLPTVSLVIPDQQHDMHDGSIAQGDAWLHDNIDSFVTWALHHNSLLILTWDEDDGSQDNHVVTLFVGAMIKRGMSSQHINHYTVLHMLLEMYGLRSPGESADEQSILGIWRDLRH